MSQSRNSTDTQALVQSMLQRLKLQPGREGQVYQHTPVPDTAGGDGERGASVQGVNSSPVNGFGTNGLPSKAFGISTAEIQQPGHVSEGDRGLISFSTQKDNTDSDTGENRVLGQATQTGTGQLFPAKSPKDANVSSSDRTDGESVSFGSHTPNDKNAVSTGQSRDQGQGFTPKTYVWSLKPTDGNIDTGSQEDKELHVGNGGFGGKDLQIVPTGTTNSSSRRKQRQSENKTRRWTQKIKERWRERQGSFGKKGKEDAQGDKQKSEQGTGILHQNQLMPAETLINTSDKAEERTPSSLDSGDLSNLTPAHTEDGTNEGYMRSAGDFEFGLGSFSLLDEIVTGQEWAKFLNPNLSAPSANQRPSEELKIPSNHHDGNNQWSFRGTEAAPVSDVSMGQTTPAALPHVSMEVSAGKQQQHVHSEADQSEPMESGNTQSDMQSEESAHQSRPATFLRPIDLLDNSALKSRVQLNRKRQHQSADRRHERLQTGRSDGETTGTEGSTSPSSQVMKETAEESHPNVVPLYILNSSPLPLSPSSSTPPRGVLKHSISHDSESSMEVETKRRRVEENRRVRFSEEVHTIAPPELDLYTSDSEEEDSGAEEDSVIECEVEQAAMEEVAPARRPALPAWIRALKRRNTGRKFR
uniref:uncharacterized protein n=1 Tax=Semicossyphus pulcher TaxID=241346 RepID=UPI0037E85BA0